ncbi:MAG: efflux RND transporter periplasmic adaptor subunit [Taibaiella sp.]|nr:efflux RND transporter periplasmic adaptor subunit [Taibaiella sp.]
MKQYIIFPVLAIMLFSACGKRKEQTEENKKFVLSDTMIKMIALDTVRDCNVADEISLSGEVSFNENSVVKIFPRSSGQVIESRVSLGDKVHKGQVLAIIKSADIAGNYSDLSSASADLAIAKRQLDNSASLYKSGISSERDYTEAKQNYQKALSAKGKVQSILTINGGGRSSAGGTYELASPIDGYIVEKKITAGSFIRSDMGDNLFTISDLRNVWIYANVYEADIPKVKEGYNARVIPMSYPDKSFSGKIDKISQVLDPQSKAMRVRVTLDNSQMLLKPDMFARVVVSNQEGARSICIPTSALISQDGKNYVVIYNSKDSMKVAEVAILKTVNERTYVDGGVSAGQAVITKNQLLVFSQLIAQ